MSQGHADEHLADVPARLSRDVLEVVDGATVLVTDEPAEREPDELLGVATLYRGAVCDEVDQTQRVRYQMKREGDSWKVLYRTIEE